MAIARGAGTEIIRAAHLEALADGIEELIYGVQHHIYTVLSVIAQAQVLNADNDNIRMFLTGYDALGGTSAQVITIFQQDMSLAETFVWNDKFSFMGYEPVDFTAGIDSTKQDAIADQGSGVPQILKIAGEHSGDQFDVTCTYLDQNNA